MGQDDDSYIDIWARDRHLFIYEDHMAFIYMLIIILIYIYTITILVISDLHGSLKDLGKDQIV